MTQMIFKDILKDDIQLVQCKLEGVGTVTTVTDFSTKNVQGKKQVLTKNGVFLRFF